MTIKIAKNDSGFQVYLNGWSTGATYTTYDGAVRVANAIAEHAINPSGVTTIQYGEAAEAARRHAQTRAESEAGR